MCCMWVPWCRRLSLKIARDEILKWSSLPLVPLVPLYEQRGGEEHQARSEGWRPWRGEQETMCGRVLQHGMDSYIMHT